MEAESALYKRGCDKTVLIVDDNPPVRKTLVAAFRSDGFKVCAEADNGTKAVELAQQIKPDLITMDLAMPGINGLVAASALKKLFPRVPIILFTLYANKLLETEAAKAGISVVLSKTAPLCTLIDIAHEMMGGRAEPLVRAKAT